MSREMWSSRILFGFGDVVSVVADATRFMLRGMRGALVCGYFDLVVLLEQFVLRSLTSVARWPD
ncbi:hypothetical protein L195_g046206 [Trifolium pratense]|uniref:Uncharacterized protein n=2 Tax=Trifolium pratense TaxID=57577 RepID=A0A2K3MH24_TRIPR|nr:hypothetical protein L195_g039917 [Trifolium pratense]PNX90083.1 hypothetical protein L195_g046206 [Trifolium pratense]